MSVTITSKSLEAIVPSLKIYKKFCNYPKIMFSLTLSAFEQYCLRVRIYFLYMVLTLDKLPIISLFVLLYNLSATWSVPLLSAKAGNEMEMNVAKSIRLEGDSRGNMVSKISRLRLCASVST